MLNSSRDNDHLQSYRHKRNYLCIGEKNSCLIYNQKVKSWFNCEWWNVIWNGIGGNSIFMFNFSSSVIIRNIWKCNNSIFVQKQLQVIQDVSIISQFCCWFDPISKVTNWNDLIQYFSSESLTFNVSIGIKVRFYTKIYVILRTCQNMKHPI